MAIKGSAINAVLGKHMMIEVNLLPRITVSFDSLVGQVVRVIQERKLGLCCLEQEGSSRCTLT